MSVQTLADANKAARALQDQIGAPRSVLTVLPWKEHGKITLMVMVDPRYAGHFKIPDYFEGFRVDIRSKKPIHASN